MIYFNYYMSVFIWQICNPFGFYQSLLQNVGQAIALLRSFFTKKQVTYIPMSLPFDGSWKVFNGGIDKINSHSWNIISQRYAYDFIISEDTDKNVKHKKKRPEDYLSFNENVYAPGDGLVVKVKNNIKDNNRAGTGKIDIWTKDIRGNFITIKHEDNIYSLVAHLKKKSCLVKKGDTVKRGQVIAKCGNSGHSTQPHVHFQVQDKLNWYFSKGLPIMFAGIIKNNTIDDKDYNFISRNDIVSNIKVNSEIIKKTNLESNSSDDLVSSLVLSIVNIIGIIIGGGFIYYTIIRLLIKVMHL